MITNLLSVKDLAKTVLSYVVNALLIVYDFLFDIINRVLGLLNMSSLNYKKPEDMHLLIGAGAIVGLIILLIIIKVCKKKKVKFYDGNKKIAKVKVRRKREIPFPEAPEKEGMAFIGWYKDGKFTKPYNSKVLLKNKKLKLYARYVVKVENEESLSDDLSAVVSPIENTSVQPAYEVESVQPQVVEPVIEEKEVISDATSTQPYEKEGLTEIAVLDEPISKDIIVEEKTSRNKDDVKLNEFYDNIRYEMLTYERALPFKHLGVIRKQVIAEMFERDNKIYLYLAVDPALMKEKGYNVIGHDELEFSIVPCLKEITTKQDYEEALELINEAMVLNNFIKSEVVFAQKIKSDEVTRKNGFAFYVKNDNVVTSANHYYNFMRALVLSYKVSVNRKYPANLDNKLILKIFKKEERIFIYLALDAGVEGLEFVGYDKNFVDTPAMFEIKTAEDCVKANALIDKLMYRFGMEKCPEQVEVSLDEVVETNCGFGYRIRR